MKTLIISLLSLCALSCGGTGGGGGGLDANGVCNICPTAKMVNTAGCAEQGTKSKCTSAAIKSVTNDSCSLGKPATTHDTCTFEHCELEFECSTVVKY